MSTATTTDLQQAARWFHALSDETRLRIVQMLGGGECCVCDLQSSLGAAQSRLSFHLRALKDAGLVTDRREGRWNYYTLVPEALDRMAEYVTVAKPAEHARGCGCSGCC
jgi:ArsR family transcriptional regulator, arsenate/arsenite/antimonite-responsive transcriptional repressor